MMFVKKMRCSTPLDMITIGVFLCPKEEEHKWIKEGLGTEICCLTLILTIKNSNRSHVYNRLLLDLINASGSWAKQSLESLANTGVLVIKVKHTQEVSK